MSFGDEIADWISEHAGSWGSVWLHTIWFLLWFDLGLDVNLLTIIVSLEAIYLCVFLLMSGNRQGGGDKIERRA
jgi:CRP/FNR family cyclic AMP-dependent transcriptional regulator